MVNAMIEANWFAFTVSLIAVLPGGWAGVARSFDDDLDDYRVLSDGTKVRRSFGNEYVDANGGTYVKNIDDTFTKRD